MDVDGQSCTDDFVCVRGRCLGTVGSQSFCEGDEYASSRDELRHSVSTYVRTP